MSSRNKIKRALVTSLVPLSLVASMGMPAIAEEASALNESDAIVVMDDSAATPDDALVTDAAAQESANDAATNVEGKDKDTKKDKDEDKGEQEVDAQPEPMAGVAFVNRDWVMNEVTEWDDVTDDTALRFPAGNKLEAGTYVLDRDVTIDGLLTISGNVNLVLCDGCTLECKGVYVEDQCRLEVYGQTGETGRIVSRPDYGAGIGGTKDDEYGVRRGGNVIIHSGTVDAVGHKNCAGIGSNDGHEYTGDFVVYGGTVIAQGGDSGAGIGGGRGCEGGWIRIYGGNVTATGGDRGAGIGGGDGQGTNPMKGGHAGRIEVFGGTVTAQGGDDAAGIGGGEGGNAGTVTISGGTITSTGGNNGAGIGCGELESTGNGGAVHIRGGNVHAIAGSKSYGIGGGSKCEVELGEANSSTDSLSINADSYRGTVTLAHDFISEKGIFAAGAADDLDLLGGYALTPFDGNNGIRYLDPAKGPATYNEPCHTIKKNTKKLTTGWYLVTGEVKCNDRIVVEGDVKIILSDGCKLNATEGITVNDGNSLTIWSQSYGENQGKLVAKDVNKNRAAIGGGEDKEGGEITINGGNIDVKGGKNAAGIGGGAYSRHDKHADGDADYYGGHGARAIRIYGGVINAQDNGYEDKDFNEHHPGGIGSAFCASPCEVTIGYTDLSKDSIRIKATYNATIKLEKPFQNGKTAMGADTYWHITDSNKGQFYNKEIFAWDGSIENVEYFKREWNGSSVEKTSERIDETWSVFPASKTIEAGSYVLNYDAKVDGLVTLKGDVNLVLCDGCTLDCKGIYVPKGSTLNVYGQWDNTGKIYSRPSTGAGIGANKDGRIGGNVVIHGGTIDAKGAKNCAGIGANDGNLKEVGDFTMYGGKVIVEGGESGAGIGGGRACEGGHIRIYGGEVTATGGKYGAGIGGGNGQDKPVKGAHAGNIEIWGGTITAKGGNDAAGIGGGEGGNAGSIAIHGGKVTATAGSNASAIGCGELESTGNGGSVLIDGGEIHADGDAGNVGIGGGNKCKVNLGYTDAARDSISIDTTSYSGDVVFDKAFKNDYGLYIPGVWCDLRWVAAQPITALVAPVPSFKGHELSLDGNAGVDFLMDLPEGHGVDYKDSYVEFNVHGRSTKVSLSEAKKSKDGKSYVFSCHVSALEMAEEITATYHYVSLGSETTITETYSVEDYIKQVKDAGEDQDEIALVEALSNYGHHAQVYLSKSNGWKFGKAYAAMQTCDKLSYTDDELSAIKEALEPYRIERNTNSCITGINSSIKLDSDASMSLSFKTVEQYSGKMVAYVDGNEVEMQKLSDGRYKLVIEDIPVREMGKMHDVRIETETGSLDVKVSALSHVLAGIEKPKSEEESYAMAAIYEYYTALVACGA